MTAMSGSFFWKQIFLKVIRLILFWGYLMEKKSYWKIIKILVISKVEALWYWETFTFNWKENTTFFWGHGLQRKDEITLKIFLISLTFLKLVLNHQTWVIEFKTFILGHKERSKAFKVLNIKINSIYLIFEEIF